MNQQSDSKPSLEQRAAELWRKLHVGCGACDDHNKGLDRIEEWHQSEIYKILAFAQAVAAESAPAPHVGYFCPPNGFKTGYRFNGFWENEREQWCDFCQWCGGKLLDPEDAPAPTEEQS